MSEGRESARLVEPGPQGPSAPSHQITVAPPSLPRPAIPAAKNWLGDELLYRFIARSSLQHAFDSVWLQHHGPLPDPARGPLLLYLNHGSWWDGYMMYVIHRVVLGGRFDVHLMMEEQQLRAFRFFSWSGAFSVNRRDPEETRRSIAYAAELLRGGRRPRALFIFPQGKIVPADRRPLVTYPGVARIIAMAGNVTLCPVAMRYEFLGQQWPHAFMRLGPLHRAADPQHIDGTLAELTARLTEACDALREDVLEQRLDRFQRLLRGRRGIDEVFGALMEGVRRPITPPTPASRRG